MEGSFSLGLAEGEGYPHKRAEPMPPPACPHKADLGEAGARPVFTPLCSSQVPACPPPGPPAWLPSQDQRAANKPLTQEDWASALVWLLGSVVLSREGRKDRDPAPL